SSGDTAERASEQQPRGGQQGATGPTVHVDSGCDVRPDSEHGRPNGGSGHQSASPVRLPLQLLRSSSRAIPTARLTFGERARSLPPPPFFNFARATVRFMSDRLTSGLFD